MYRQHTKADTCHVSTHMCTCNLNIQLILYALGSCSSQLVFIFVVSVQNFAFSEFLLTNILLLLLLLLHDYDDDENDDNNDDDDNDDDDDDVPAAER